MSAKIKKTKNDRSWLWLIGTLFDARASTHFKAIRETLFYITWSVIPFLIITLWIYITDKSEENLVLFDIVRSTIQNGELIVVMFTLFGPILYWIAFDSDSEQSESFPHKAAIILILIFISISNVVLFIAYKTNSIARPNALQISLFCFLITVAIRYIACVYHHHRLTPKEIHRDPEDDFLKNLQSYLKDK